jgi:capsular polysaccharide export protein
MKRILFYVVVDTFVPFLWQLSRYVEARGFEAHFAAFLPREHLWLTKLGVRLVPGNAYEARDIPPASAWFSDSELDDMLAFSIDKHGGSRAVWEARVALAAKTFVELFDSAPFEAAFIWNGQDAIGRALAMLAKRRGITVVYGENGYFSRTLQFDLEGVNAQSSLNRLSLQDMRDALAAPAADAPPHAGFALGDVVPLAWRDYATCFIKRKADAHYYEKFPEHRGGSSFKNWWLQRQRQLIPADQVELPANFVFIPFQVHDDTQILLNSPNFRSMETFFEFSHAAIRRHFGEHQKIVVKEHPEDLGRHNYDGLKTKYPEVIWLRKFDIDALIDRAACVFVVNSSVGLQAVRKLRPTVVFGDSFYTRPELVFDATDLNHADASIEAAKKGVDVSRQANIKTFIDFLTKRYFIASGWKDFSAEGIALTGERVVRLLNMRDGMAD